MVGQHHQLNGYEFEETPGDSGGQQSQACCSLWGCKELYTTQRLNNTDTETRFWFPEVGGGAMGEVNEVDQKVQIYSYKVNKPQGCNAQ